MAQLPVGRGVTALAFAGDGSRLGVGTLGGRITVWEMRTAELAHEVATAGTACEAVALSADGTTVAACGRDGSIWLRRLPRPVRADPPAPVQALSASRVLTSSYRLFDWLRRVALL